jgi:hypothetical protein
LRRAYKVTAPARCSACAREDVLEPTKKQGGADLGSGANDPRLEGRWCACSGQARAFCEKSACGKGAMGRERGQASANEGKQVRTRASECEGAAPHFLPTRERKKNDAEAIVKRALRALRCHMRSAVFSRTFVSASLSSSLPCTWCLFAQLDELPPPLTGKKTKRNTFRCVVSTADNYENELRSEAV